MQTFDMFVGNLLGKSVGLSEIGLPTQTLDSLSASAYPLKSRLAGVAHFLAILPAYPWRSQSRRDDGKNHDKAS
jgi:hypothetical protein